MPRKYRVAKPRTAALPSPAWTWWQLTGADPGCRLRGWVGHAQQGHFGEPTAAMIWAAHRDALVELAAVHGFEPSALTHRRPAGGDAFTRWRAAFLAQHTY